MPQIIPALGAIGTWIGANAATVASVASTAATIGSTVASSQRKVPTPNITPPPDPAKAEEAKAQERRRAGQRQGFRSTILSNALKEYSPQQGKTTFGQ